MKRRCEVGVDIGLTGDSCWICLRNKGHDGPHRISEKAADNEPLKRAAQALIETMEPSIDGPDGPYVWVNRKELEALEALVGEPDRPVVGPDGTC